jgi:hypothetical protein
LKVAETVLCTGGPHVELLKEVHTLVISENGPNPYVELSTLEEQRLFDVFLNDKLHVFCLLPVYVVQYVSGFVEKLDATTLVASYRFHEPHILQTVLKRHFFLLTAAQRKFLKPVHERRCVLRVEVLLNKERGRCSVKHRVITLYSLLVGLVILLEALDELALCRDALRVLEVVKHQG